MRSAKIFLIAVVLAAVCVALALSVQPSGPAGPRYQDPSQPLDARVADLVGRMTLEEKVSQLTNSAAAIPRLGIPAYDWWNEALHGVARAGLATVFPQAIGLAATWDTALMRRVATTIADEARAKHHEFARHDRRGLYHGLTFWSPNINIFRDPRWGRGMETYGEDPYLAGRLAVEFVKGMQGDDPRYLKTIATPKHYAVHSGPESDRHTFDARIDERDLRDTYLPQFEAAVTEGGAMSVMCAYNRFDGEACCASPRLLADILRKEWSFAGYVVSDCDAIWDIYSTHKMVATSAEAAALAVKAGCDLNCGDTYKHLVNAVRKGLLAERDVDRALSRLLLARFRLGMFDPPAQVRWAQIPYSVVDSPEHRQLALEAARKSIVLLKNDRQTLPLSRERVRSIAVIGPNADDEEVLLGNYNGTPSHPVTPLEGIRRKVGDGARVLHAVGSDWAEGMPVFEVVPASALRTRLPRRSPEAKAGEGLQQVRGLTGEYFDNRDLKGAPVFTRVDAQVDFHWWEKTPDPRLKDNDTVGIRWTGDIVPPVTGTYQIGGYGLRSFRIYLDDALLVRFSSNHEASRTVKPVELKAGEPHALRIEYFEQSPDARMQLVWTVPDPDREHQAIEAAKQADATVLFLGLSPRLEGEEMRVEVPGFKGGDRVDIGLPASQQRLLEAVTAIGKPVVLVLLNGSALACTWAADKVPAIVEAWYPGQAAGDAIADVLFGDYNPAGRLPVTFYKSADQLPAFSDYRMTGRTYRYFTGDALFPFGHGLSYTRFAYRDLSAPASVPAGQPVELSVDVENSGDRAGEEVVQVYVTHVVRSPESGVRSPESVVRSQSTADIGHRTPDVQDASLPIRALAGFTRVALKPHERTTVRFELTPRELAIVNEQGQRVVEPGVVRIVVGGKQPGFTGVADAMTTQTVTTKVQVTGARTIVK
jgi:beta-glucosidase